MVCHITPRRNTQGGEKASSERPQAPQAAGTGAQGMLRFYTEDSPGLIMYVWPPQFYTEDSPGLIMYVWPPQFYTEDSPGLIMYVWPRQFRQ
jgi:hypothetical protein